LLTAAIASWSLRRHAWGDRVFASAGLTGCVTLGVAAVYVLGARDSASLVVPATTPGGDWIFAIDRLSAVFLLAIALIGGAAVVFGTSYMAAQRPHRPVWFAHSVLALLVAALALVVMAQSIVPFLIAWELMAIGSYLLIVTDDEDAAVRRAGLIYIVATHTGTLALFAMFASWSAHTSDWSFAALASAAPNLPNQGTAILALALIGFGLKAGLVPFHFWLPPAHAAAPPHGSAILSGIVIKMGIYGMFRVLSLLGAAPPLWWGWIVLLLGAVSGVLGVLWALAQHDIKRLLAYHSVENIGIILMGLGLGALGIRYGYPALALIGYTGALLHTVNHALFKSLLFLGAGVVNHATGTRDLDKLGGLARRLPFTGLTFTVGATAIVGLPPLNGFVSEWLVYQGLFRAAQSEDLLRLAVLGVPALALIGALALACFAKVVGVVFLGSPRSVAAQTAHEGDRGQLAPMGVLAAACVLLGVVPALGIVPAMAVAVNVAPELGATLPDAVAVARAGQWVGAVAVALILLVALVFALRRWLMRRSEIRSEETWSCGFEGTSPRMQYTASSFADPLLSTFGRIGGVVEKRTPSSYSSHALDLVLDRLVLPAWDRVHRTALRLRPIQQGRLYVYLLYVMVALLVLLAYLALA
jgi:hydrogenase-4 component B